MIVLLTTPAVDPGESGEGGEGGGEKLPSPEPEPDPKSPLASSASSLNPPEVKSSKSAGSLPTASPCASSALKSALLEAGSAKVWAVSHVDVTPFQEAAIGATSASTLNSLDSADAALEERTMLVTWGFPKR